MRKPLAISLSIALTAALFPMRIQAAASFHPVTVYQQAAKSVLDTASHFADDVKTRQDPASSFYENQHDPRWNSLDVTGYGTIGTTGCFPTVATMALEAAGQDTDVIDVAHQLHDNGYYGVVRGNLLSEGTFSDAWQYIEDTYDVSCTPVRTAAEMEAALQTGTIAGSVNDIFVSGGNAHEILLAGCCSGKVYVLDPNNEQNNGWYGLEEILDCGSTEWWNQFEGSPFVSIQS